MSKKDKAEVMKVTVWFNLFIGLYNLYVFNEINSIFHLLLGSANIGVWVFFRQRYLDFSLLNFLRLNNKKQTSSNN
tara:strand:- start:76 stop:303 length:228 start_codon:yes stop_codon:yes gene_type:complete